MTIEIERSFDRILSGSNTEMRGVVAAEILANGSAIDVTTLHETIYDTYNTRPHVEVGRRIHAAETRQQLRRMDNHGYYALDDDADFVELTELGEISAGASGYLLEAGLDTGVSIMSVVGYTAFSPKSSNISATHQLVELVMQDPERPLPLQTAVEECDEKNGQFKLYYRMMRNLASSGVLTLTRQKIPGEFNGHKVVCMTGPDTTSASGQLILSFVERYLEVSKAAKNNPESLKNGINLLLETEKEAVNAGMIGPLILRGLETARRYSQK